MSNDRNNLLCWIVVVAFLLMVLGCGSTGGTGDPIDPNAYTISVALYNADTGENTDVISEGNPGILKVSITDGYGSPAANLFIEVTTTKGSFENSDGTNKTDINGMAEFILKVDPDQNGAGQIGITIGTETEDGIFTFVIGAPDSVKLGAFINGIFQEGILLAAFPGSGMLAIGSNATITATLAIYDGTTYVPYASGTVISFASRCSGALISDPVYEGNGTTTVTYAAGTCTQTSDTITATSSISGANLTASVDIALVVPDTGSIEFVSAEPDVIALAGSANSQLPSTSLVTFLVKDEIGNPVSGENVDFSLTTTVGGLSIAPASSVTNSEGLVTVIITSGSVSTSVRVKATVNANGTEIFAQSSELVISTGLPDQNSFSISAEYWNPEAWNYDGEEVSITVRAADHFNNPVPDGTTIYFTAEGGAIEPSCQTGAGGVPGVCSVTWRSQDPRPDNGRVTILATAVGEESFLDTNGSGLFESTDALLTDLTEAFLDTDEDGIRDPDEEFFDFNEDFSFTLEDELYNGSLCNDIIGCSDELIHVRDSGTMVMATSFAVITIVPSFVEFSSVNDYTTVVITISDTNGNGMPHGTTVAITSPSNASVEGETNFTLPNSDKPYLFSIGLKPNESYEIGETSSLLVKVTTPKGNVTSNSIPVTSPQSIVDSEPEAFFDSETLDPVTHSVLFTDTSVAAEGTSINSWLWEFADETGVFDTSTNQTLTYSFPANRNYVVTLTVSNNLGETDSVSKVVEAP